MQAGAIASTVCHDNHNIAVVGADDADMAAGGEPAGRDRGRLRRRAGRRGARRAGAADRRADERVEPFEDGGDELVALRAAARGSAWMLEEPFLQLAFLALPVIPELKITDRGLVDVEKFELVNWPQPATKADRLRCLGTNSGATPWSKSDHVLDCSPHC